MKFKKIKWKNLLSYGNKIQEYEFGDKPSLVLVEGENGAGKSTIKEALTISAYGRSAIRKMKDIPNWLNKAAYTYNEFETSKGDNVIIERGIDPNFSNIQINGVPYNLPDKRKIDEFIENELLHLNFPIFCNTISLSFDDFKSFVNLSASDKRKIVDPMFGIDILGDMKSSIKEDLKEHKKNLEIAESDVTRNNRLLDTSIEQLDELKKKIEELAVDKSKEIKDDLKSNDTKLKKHQEKYNEIKTKIEGIQTKASEFRQKAANCRASISDFDSKLTLFEENKCPHCLSDLTGDAAIEIKESIEQKKKTEDELLTKINKNIEKATKLVDDLVPDRDFEKDKYYEINAIISKLKEELEAAQEDIKDDQESSIETIIGNIRKELKSSEDDSNEHKGYLELYEILDEIVSDSGIKRTLIDRVIPLLNSRIAEISDRLDFKFNFEFNNEFDPIITYMGMEISPTALSTGQRKKMNLIVLLSFIELIKLKHGNMNVMFLDEIFSGLDKNNVYKAIGILREYADKYNMTIFVVSHESLPEEFFDQKIMVTMPNHFSEIEITAGVRTNKELV